MPHGQKTAGVVHTTLNAVGGGERVCLTVIEALLESEFDVTLFTLERTDWNRLGKIFGIPKFKSPHFHEKHPLIWDRPRAFSVYHRLLARIYTSMVYNNRFDFIINTGGDINPIKCSYTYMHFPAFLFENSEAKYRKGTFWRVYHYPYLRYQQRLYPHYLSRTKIICNSKFTQKALKSRYPDYGDMVLYPPLELCRFQDAYNRSKREDIVVTCSRFIPDKNLQVIPTIASNTPEVEYHLYGGTHQLSDIAIKKILEEKEKLGCSNVHLHPDASIDEIISMYRRAKIYLHTMIGEHFGISIVEGMAAGLVPVVHKSGGACSEIIENEKYGFCYQKPEEASEIIKSIILDQRKQEEYRELAAQRSQLFDKENFKEQFLRFISADI